MFRLGLIASLVCLVACVGLVSADPVTFAVTQSGTNGQFGTLDLGTGAFTALGSVRSGGYSGIGNLADGTLVGVDGNNNFIQIDGSTGAITVIGPTGINVTTSASLLTGEQYAIDDHNQLFQIDPATGTASLLGPTGIPFDLRTFANGLAGDDMGSLYYIYQDAASISTLYQLDLTSGAATPIGLTGAAGIVGAGFAGGVLYAYNLGHEIYTIDVTSGLATDTGVGHSTAFVVYGTTSAGQ
jgi:hypothetical protein